MTEWAKVGRGKIDVLGINREAPGSLNISIALTGTIQREWAQFFLHPTDAPAALGTQAPTLSGGSVKIYPPDDKIEAYIKDVDERIAAANARYETDVLAGIHEQEKVVADAKALEDARIAAARHIVAGL